MFFLITSRLPKLAICLGYKIHHINLKWVFTVVILITLLIKLVFKFFTLHFFCQKLFFTLLTCSSYILASHKVVCIHTIQYNTFEFGI